MMTLAQQVVNAQVVLNCAVRSCQRLTGQYEYFNDDLVNMNVMVANLVCVLEKHPQESTVSVPYSGDN